MRGRPRREHAEDETRVDIPLFDNRRLGRVCRYYFDISTIGRSAHTCHRDLAINAIEKMLPIIRNISRIRCVPANVDPFVRDLVGAELHIAVGRIYGGLFPGGPSMIPDRCTIRVDTRPQPGVPVEEVQELLEAAIREAQAEDPQIKVELAHVDSHLVPTIGVRRRALGPDRDRQDIHLKGEASRFRWLRASAITENARTA